MLRRDQPSSRAGRTALARVKKVIEEFEKISHAAPLDALLSNASGCGTMLKDYGDLLKDDPDWAERAAVFSGATRDISEYLAEIGISPGDPMQYRVAYQSACSLNHGQGVHQAPVDLLRNVGFDVVEPNEPGMCCGSAGTYNLLQIEMAEQLGKRKADCLEATSPEIIASGNLGCMTQLQALTELPVVHTVELIDWATGGPRPDAIKVKENS